MGLDDVDHLTGQTSSDMSSQLIDKKKKSKKKNKNNHNNNNNNNNNDIKTVVDNNSVANQQQQLQLLIEQMQQHLQQQQQQQLQPVNNVGNSNFQNNLPQYGGNDLPQYNPTSRPFQQTTTVSFPSGFNQFNPSERPVSESFPYSPVQTTARPIQNQYVSSTPSFNDGLPEYNPGLAQYGSSGFQNGLSEYSPTNRPSVSSTSAPIEQAQYNIVSTPAQSQYGQNNQFQTQDLPQYSGNNQQSSNFRGSPNGESWLPNQNNFQSTYHGSGTPSPSPSITFSDSKPVRFPAGSGSGIQQYPISRIDPYENQHYDDDYSHDDWYDPMTHSYHQPVTSLSGADKSGPLVPPPTYGKNHYQNLDSSRPSINIIAELAKYSNRKNILGQGNLGGDQYISYDSNPTGEGSEIILYPSGKKVIHIKAGNIVYHIKTKEISFFRFYFRIKELIDFVFKNLERSHL